MYVCIYIYVYVYINICMYLSTFFHMFQESGQAVGRIAEFSPQNLMCPALKGSLGGTVADPLKKDLLSGVFLFPKP